MHAWLCDNPVGVDALRWNELPTPEPAAGQVVIEIRAASLNFPDLLMVQNKYQIKPPLPFVPGSEFSGCVASVGDGVRHLKVGDRVAAIGVSGGFATHACVDAALVMPLPPGFDFDDAAAFAFTYGTSHHALIDRAALRVGETVLVLGAAGGVGTAAVQIAKAAGARVIAAASSEHKCRSVADSAPMRPSTRAATTCARRSRQRPTARGPTSSTTRSVATLPSRVSARSPGAAAIS